MMEAVPLSTQKVFFGEETKNNIVYNYIVAYIVAKGLKNINIIIHFIIVFAI